MAQQMYIASDEIEQEPDGDSDDINVATGNYPANKPGNMAVALDAPLTDELTEHSAQTMAQDVSNNLATEYGIALNSTYNSDSNDLQIVAKDSTGTVTNDIFIDNDGATIDQYFGSTKNGSSLGGGYWTTTVDEPSSTGTPTIETDMFSPADLLTETDIVNEDGSSLATTMTTNADGSQTVGTIAPLTKAGAPTGEGKGVTTADALEVDTFASDAIDYAKDKALDLLTKVSPSLKAIGEKTAVIVQAYDVFKSGTEVGTLANKLYSEWDNNQPMSDTATELSAKIAVTALSVLGIPFAESIVKLSTDVGDSALGMFLDKVYEWQHSGSMSVVEQTTDHQPPTLKLTLPDSIVGSTTTVAAADTAAAAAVAQHTLYTWSGLDTQGFEGAKFPGVGLQDLTTNKTSVVTAAYSGGSAGNYSVSDVSNHNLDVMIGSDNLSVTTGNGNDTFFVDYANAAINGGGGTNTANILGTSGDFRFSVAKDGTEVLIGGNPTIAFVAQDNSLIKGAGASGEILLRNVQSLKFLANGVTETAASTPITAMNTIGISRFFDTKTGTHFFSSDQTEVANVKATRPDLTYEGVTFQSQDSTNKDPSDAPIYRFFDKIYGTHFYTASVDEANSVKQSRPDLTYEGVGFTEHVNAQPGDQAVYRFFDTVHGTHFYSSNDGEKANISSTRPDLKYEGVGFYAPTYTFG